MTIKQYQKLAAAVAVQIKNANGDINAVRHLRFICPLGVIARDPKRQYENESSFKSGNFNVEISFDTISNPNNPNANFRTLKPGSMSFYNSETMTNVDITDYNFDSSQFADLIDAVSTNGWKILD